MSFLPIDRGRKVAFAAGVFYEQDFPGFDDSNLAITSCDLYGRVQVHNILSARCRMPIEIVFSNI